jgi:hypothetical protein
MADSDYNVVKPLESVQTIQGLAPPQRRQPRKRQQDAPPEPRKEPQEQEPSEAPETPEARQDEDGPHLIDYCA